MANSELKLTKQPLKPVLMLKDYLLDDLSSCSSNGFRSFPRRQQCCTTVRFLHEIDRNNNKKHPSISKKKLLRSRSKAASASSVLHRASEAVINAVKHFPFTSVKARKASIFSRSFSRKLLRQSVWKRTDQQKVIKRLKSFGQLIDKKTAVSDFTTTVPTVVTTTTTTTESNTSTSNSYCHSNSWSDSDFTVTTLDNSEVNSSENNVVDSKRHLQEKEINNRVGAESTKFGLTGSKRKPKHKARRFESLSQLEPVDLEKLIALSESKDMHESVKSPLQLCPTSVDEERETKQGGAELFEQMKVTTFSHNFTFKATKSLLLGFFTEKIIEGNACDNEVLEVAKEWMNGQPRELFLEWEVKRSREAYIRDMEKGVKWSKMDDEEKRDVALEVEGEVFNSLVNEVLLDLFAS